MVKKKFKTKLLASVVLGLFSTASPAIAFFVGNLEVKSKFGGKFEGSFKMNTSQNIAMIINRCDISGQNIIKYIF